MDIIIPTKNAEQDLSDCLEALLKQTIDVNVIIVDANSTDRTREIAIEYGATIIDEPPSKVKGSKRAVACNEGLRHSLSRIVGFIDADTIVPRTWAEDLSSYLVKPIGAITSGCVSSEESNLSKGISNVLRLGSDSHGRSFDEPTEVQSAGGYNAVYLREVIDFAGGFSEIIGGCEDWELNYRLRKSGWKVLGVPTSPVEHRERRTLKGFSKQMWGYGWSRSRLLMKKHIFTPIHAIPSISLVLFLLFTIWQPSYGLTALMLVILVSGINYWWDIIPFLPFTIFFVSWSLGYLRGLLEL